MGIEYILDCSGTIVTVSLPITNALWTCAGTREYDEEWLVGVGIGLSPCDLKDQ